MYPLRASLILLLLCLYSAGFGQTVTPYSFQLDDENLKKVYFDQSMAKKKVLLANLGKSNASEYKKIYDSQFKEIGDLWQSSRCVTDPVANNYLQSVLKRIISVNPELANTDARVVFSRDAWPNAYSMGDGTIAVNAGLFVYLQSEAQLVFILCHELAHYYLDHTGKAIRKYVETVTSPSYQAELKRLSKEKYRVNQQLEVLSEKSLFSIRRHKRENEAEADRIAFYFMKNTGYNGEGIRSCLQLLDSVDDSLLYKPEIVEEVFNLPGHPFKSKWIKKESSIFSQMNSAADEDTEMQDSLKTHPDCLARIGLLEDSLKSIEGKGNMFLVDETKFASLRKDFFLEMTEQCFRDDKLSRYLFLNLQLINQQEYKTIAAYSIIRCLNLLYEKQREHTIGKTIDTEHPGYKPVYNDLLRMLSRIRLDELAELSYQFSVAHSTLLSGYPGFEAEMQKAKNRRTN